MKRRHVWRVERLVELMLIPRSKVFLDTLGARQAVSTSIGTGRVEPGFGVTGLFGPPRSVCRYRHFEGGNIARGKGRGWHVS